MINGVTTTDQFGYDLAARLATVTRGGSLVASYIYDANGNRTGVTTPAGTVTATYDSQDRILTSGSRTYTHTAHGDVASWTENGATTTLTYDVLGNLLQVVLPSGDVVGYIVDGRSRRVGKTINGEPVQGWLYGDQLRPIAELDASGNIVARFVYGTRLNIPEYHYEERRDLSYRLRSAWQPARYCQRRDPHGDSTFGIRCVRRDRSGFEFGLATVSFRRRAYDPDTGLLRFHTRDCDPKLGRFFTRPDQVQWRLNKSLRVRV